MFEYTPNASVRHILERSRRARYTYSYWYLSWEDRNQLYNMIGTPHDKDTYQLKHRLEHLHGFRFFSPKRLSVVPFQGYLVPVHMFEEREVQQ